jgi:peptidoglycan/LPS O-acetylase OafA/YrhL
MDSLRFVAAAAVVMQHSFEGRGEIYQAIVDALSPGVFGVVLFFLVSGFVISFSAGQNFNLLKFAIRRFFRLYPLLLTTFTAVAVIAHISPSDFGNVRSAELSDWIANLLLIQDYTGNRIIHGVTWTLSLEAIWYTIFAMAMIVIGRRFDNALVVIAPCLLMILAAFSLIAEIRLPTARLGMLYAALIGCRAYYFFVNELSRRRLLFDVAVFLASMLICNLLSFGYFKHPNITAAQAVIPWLAAPILFAIVCVRPKIQNSRLLNAFSLVWLGTISYSMYLLHPLAIYLADLCVAPELSLPCGLLLTVLLSAVGYHFVEVPGQALGRRFTAHLAR